MTTASVKKRYKINQAKGYSSWRYRAHSRAVTGEGTNEIVKEGAIEGAEETHELEKRGWSCSFGKDSE